MDKVSIDKEDYHNGNKGIQMKDKHISLSGMQEMKKKTREKSDIDTTSDKLNARQVRNRDFDNISNIEDFMHIVEQTLQPMTPEEKNKVMDKPLSWIRL